MKNTLLLSGLLLAGMVSLPAMAADGVAGAKPLKASVSSSTCTINNLTGDIKLGDFPKSMVENLSPWEGIRNDGRTLSISGCGVATKKVDVTLTSSRHGENAIVTEVFDVKTPADNSKPQGAAAWPEGETKSYALINGGVDVPLTFWTSRFGAGEVKTGVFMQNYSFSVDFS